MTTNTAQVPLSNLVFNHRFINNLPADSEMENYRRQVTSACYSYVKPKPVASPRLIAYSLEMAQELELSGEECESELFTEVFSGNKLLNEMKPYAQCYGGHQFGRWAGQLGDGRAINLGEVINEQGRHQVLQLKGAGETPYSRTADGLAVLRSSVREFLCSEAMHHLGIPTTRALSLISTGEFITRDMFYDGNPKQEPGAVVCRVAPSFLRFGSFEIFTARNDIENLTKLANYTIKTDFPHLGTPSKETYIKWFDEVCQRTAEMIVHWMRVGFVHGVMNTDNMSILGLTIDYGPYGWLENYDPDWTPNTTDASRRRYRFGHQAQIAQWNLIQLANALYPLINDVKPLEECIIRYQDSYRRKSSQMQSEKLGLTNYKTPDVKLFNDLHTLLQITETDMTLFYRNLAKISSSETQSNEQLLAPLKNAFYKPEQLTDNTTEQICDWLRQYQQRLQQENSSDTERRKRMNAVNPKYVLRNYLAQLAIDKAEQNDFSLVNELLDLLRRPNDEQPDKEQFAAKRPDWARHRAGCSMLSCSS